MAIFAKCHYEAVATAMQGAHPGMGLGVNNRAVTQWYETVLDMADMFARDNTKFKRDRFVAACQPGADAGKCT